VLKELKNTEGRVELTIPLKMKTKTELTTKNDPKINLPKKQKKLKKPIKRLKIPKMNDLIKIDLVKIDPEANSEIPHPPQKYFLLL